jgi:predicted CXXCH cytochrome family protein
MFLLDILNRPGTNIRRIHCARIILTLLLACGFFWVTSVETHAQTQIARTLHNLTPSGTGSFRVGEPAGLCVFCHTPHNANPTRALWNRDFSGATYQLYESTTLESTPSQPTGSSRLCLSCHDGILALGNVRAVPPGGNFSLGPLTGRAALGTDLSDDHPISFVYDTALALRRGELADPSVLPGTVKLDDTGQVQCTTCHNPHEDRNPKFLRVDNRFGALCTTCHDKRHWTDASHATSSATWNGTGTNPWPDPGFPTVAENACLSCHRPHAGGHPERLLAQAEEVKICTVCHSGTVAQKNIETEFLKPFRHPIDSTPFVHDPGEDPQIMPRHVICMDCHNPHAVKDVPALAPAATGRQRGVSGLSISGVRVDEVTNEYEVCLKCHGVREPTTPGAVRQDSTRNIRLRIDPANPSYHPVAASGKNTTIQGLIPPLTASSVIYCTNCHNNNDWTPTGTAPRGPHGSLFEPILEREFQAGDPVVESPAAYALCYKCHNRTTLLNNGRFPHDAHLLRGNVSCSSCHDVHGSRQHIRLINFKLRTREGGTVVSPNSNGRLEFVPDLSRPGRGECSLSCHGQDHDRRSY